MQWLDKLKGFREIGAYLMMGVLALSIVNGLIRVFDTGDWDPGFAARAYYSYGSFTHSLAAVVLTLLVLSLAAQAPKSPRAGMIALLGAILTGIGTLAIFLLGLIGIGAEVFSSGLGRFSHILVWLIALIIPAVVTAVLLLVYLGAKPAPAYQHPQQYGSQAPQGHLSGQPGMPAQPGYPQHGAPQAPAPQQPTWQPDQASGGAWQSAGQAASGASATEWGQPGQQHQGWVPQSASEPPAQQQPQQQGWSAPQSASEPGPQQWGQPPAEQPWQPVDPNQPGGGYR